MAALLGLAAMLPFAAVLFGDFVWDDHVVFETNEQLGLADLPGYWLQGEASSTGIGRTSRYNPLGWTLFSLETVLAGDARPPWLYHATSLLLHGVGVALLAALLLVTARVGGARQPRLFAGIGAGWFAIAPVQAEVVCFPAAQFDSLAWLLLGGGALLAVTARSDLGQLAGGLLAATSMLSKEATLPALLVLPLLLPFLRDREGWRRPALWGWTAAGAWGGVVAVMAARRAIGIVMPSALGESSVERIVASFAALFRMAVLQEQLSLMRPITTVPGDVDLVVLGLFVVIGVVGLFKRWTFEGRAAAGGALWMACLLAPHAAAAVGFELQPDRYAYLALPGLGMVVASGATARPIRGLLPVLGLLGLLFVVRDVHQTQRWFGDVELFTWEVEQFPEAPQTWYHLGMVLRNEGLPDEADAALAEAARLGPFLPQTWGELAELRANRGDVAGALRAVDEGLTHLPGDPALLQLRAQISGR